MKMFDEKELNKRIKEISINSRKFIIENVGLSKNSKEILYAKYVDELSINEMCDKFGYDEKNISYKISKSKKELNKIINREFKFMNEDLKEYIKELIINTKD